MVGHPRPSALAAHPASSRPLWSTVVRNLAAQDVLVATYHALFLLLVAAGAGPTRSLSLAFVSFDLAWFLGAVLLVRSRERTSAAASIAYRMSLVGSVVASYLQLKWILPAASARVVDAQILALDMRLFHYEPAIAWDRFVTPATTEWFSFFYYGYFAVLTIHVLPIALRMQNGRALAHFGFGILFVFCVGHLTYVLVPGLGPYAHIDTFRNPLEGRFWWPLVWDTVRAAGAHKDIFPSLHTAVPTFLALYSFLHRARRPFNVTWPITAFFTTQIVIATMFLRWHYLIDVVAGLALAVTATWLGARVARWEEERRAREGLVPLFPPAPSIGR